MIIVWHCGTLAGQMDYVSGNPYLLVVTIQDHSERRTPFMRPLKPFILKRVKEILLITTFFLPIEFYYSESASAGIFVSIFSAFWSLYYGSDEGFALRLFNVNDLFNITLWLGLNLLFAYGVVRHFDNKVSKNRIRAWAILSLIPMMVLNTIPALFRGGMFLHASCPILQVVGLLLVRLVGPDELESPWDGLGSENSGV